MIRFAVLKKSDIFIHPARNPEACPTSILEAMALGVPVISTKLGSIPELVINGKGGYLVSPNSPTDLAARISSTLCDEMFKSQARAFNLQWSCEFDISHVGPKIIDLYKKASLM